MNVTQPSRSAAGARARWALLIILLVAAIIRFQSLAFGLPAVNDQDELLFQLGGVRMLQGPTLNPQWFGHPATTTMYALALSDVAVFLSGMVAGYWDSVRGFLAAVYADPTVFMLPGRIVMAAFGLLSIGLAARLGERVADWRVGLSAAALLAIAPLHIEMSQIIRSDMMATCFMLASMLAAVKAARTPGSLRGFVVAGIWAGVAVATKWPSALVLVCLAGAAVLRWQEGERDLGLLFRRLVAGGGAAVVSLLVVSPFLILDWQTVATNLAGEARVHHLGATGGSFLFNLGWYAQNPLLKSLGPVGSLLALAGIVLLLRNPFGRYLLVPFLAAQMLVLASQPLVWERWFLPLLPILAIGAGCCGVWLGEWIGARRAGWGLLACAALGLATAAPMAIRARDEASERLHDTRQLATRYVMKHAAPGQSVLIEHFGFDLLKSDLRILFPVAVSGCLDARPLLTGHVSLQDVEGFRSGNSNIDMGAIPEEKVASCRADYVILSHYDRYVAEKERFPQQYARYRQFMREYETLAIFRPVTTGQHTRIVRVLRLRSPTPD